MVSEVILGLVLNSSNVLEKICSKKTPLFRKTGSGTVSVIKLLCKS